MAEVLPVLDFLVRDMLPPVPCPINKCSRAKHVLGRGSYSVLRDCHQEAGRLDVSEIPYAVGLTHCAR
jgi:hypothetical protein